MIIDCIADLHGFYPKLEGGDLLIVAGDLTARDEIEQYNEYSDWLMNQDYRKKIFISGNHDVKIMDKCAHRYMCPVRKNYELFEYLCDSGTEFEGLKIWGSPWTITFPGMNPHCKAFTLETEEQLASKFSLIPDDTDILITHSPSWGLHDTNIHGERCGSKTLTMWIANHVNSLKLFVCGHIHEGYGEYDVRSLQDSLKSPISPIHINCSHVNERYEPVNKPIRIEL